MRRGPKVEPIVLTADENNRLVEWTRRHKYWPPVGRIDDAYGDRHLVCDCGGVEEYAAPGPA